MAEMIPRLTAADPILDVVTALEESGVVRVDGMLDADVLARFNAEIDEHLEAADPGRPLMNPVIEGFFGKHTRHITGVAAKSRTFVDHVLCHPVLLGVCDAILLPSCAKYQLNIAHVLDRGPGAVQQLLHRDELVWVHLFHGSSGQRQGSSGQRQGGSGQRQGGSWKSRPHPDVQVASIIALGDFEAENGATRVIPGSHTWPLEREPRLDEVVAAEMPAGSAVLYLGSTIHGGGPNTTTDRRRRGMHHSYTLGWLRTEENHYLTTPIEVARTLPRQALDLMGYSAHDALMSGGGYLGAVDTADPLDLMEQGRL
jgi:ectoine hydroxylase-related dioxygenase (phytanoyl-CoA dioxygenase family)